MKRFTGKSAVAMVMLFGLLVTSVAPSAMADGNRRNRNDRDRYVSSYYDQDRNDDRYDDRRRDRRNNRWDDDREETTGKVVKRVGIGAGIGTVGGAVIGGKKGALIGAGVGAAGGYIYHRKKVNDQRNRGWRWPW